MTVEIITIGDEILIGQITDTNSQWIATEFNKIGVSIYQITSIQDNEEHILASLKEAEQRADLVLLTGGLGPTKDDITKSTLAKYFNDTLLYNKEVVNHIKSIFKKNNIPFGKLNDAQALLPSKATILPNTFGTASGMWFESNNTIFISLPGVPFEMKALIDRSKTYDVVIIDPPSFAKQASEIDLAKKKYAQLAELGERLTAKNGLLVLASCSSRVLAQSFFDLNTRVLHSQSRLFETVLKTQHDVDHPISFPEGAYLKCGYYRFLE